MQGLFGQQRHEIDVAVPSLAVLRPMERNERRAQPRHHQLRRPLQQRPGGIVFEDITIDITDDGLRVGLNLPLAAALSTNTTTA